MPGEVEQEHALGRVDGRVQLTVEVVHVGRLGLDDLVLAEHPTPAQGIAERGEVVGDRLEIAGHSVGPVGLLVVVFRHADEQCPVRLPARFGARHRATSRRGPG
ncbi:hypothetical protein [Streptomyces lunaelactis]|uniref:hypothetical protein n=1 Tax=Streptomyces lunaelactis TaxID=1535768 RepID=UPI003529E70A